MYLFNMLVQTEDTIVALALQKLTENQLHDDLFFSPGSGVAQLQRTDGDPRSPVHSISVHCRVCARPHGHGVDAHPGLLGGFSIYFAVEARNPLSPCGIFIYVDTFNLELYIGFKKRPVIPANLSATRHTLRSPSACTIESVPDKKKLRSPRLLASYLAAAQFDPPL